MSIGSNTLTVNATSQITGVSTAGAPANFGVPTLTLTGSPTFNVNNQGSVPVALTVTTLSGGSSSNTITKTGNGTLQVKGGNASFTNAITVSNGTLQANTSSGTADAFGTAPISIASGATLLYANGLTTWTTKNDISGNGTVQYEGGTVTGNLAGVQITPGTGGTSGKLTVAGKAAFALNGATKVGLNIDVTGGNAVAGTDYDQLAIGGSATLTGLSNANLLVKIAPGVTQADVTGDVLTIVSAAGTNFSGANFANVTGGVVNLVGMGTAQVNYNNGSITLSNISVPEPASLAAIGLVAGGVLRRRRKA
jgi:autotransporter-associated beta strand protein